MSPSASAPRRLVGAEEAAHEEVARVVLGPVLVDHEPGEEPARGERLLLGGEGGDLAAQALERRLSGELVDDVALAAGDHGLASDRPAALRDDGEDGQPRDDGADGALRVHSSPWMSACAPGRRPPTAIPPTSGTRSCASFSPVRNGPSREREGIDEQRDQPRIVELGKARHRYPLLRLHGRGVEALDLRARQRTRPDGHRRTLARARGHRATTPSATQPSRCRGASSSRTASAAASASSRCAGERKTNARSTSARPSAPPRASRAASVAASQADSEVDRPAPIRQASVWRRHRGQSTSAKMAS